MASSEPGPELDRRVGEAMGVTPGQVRNDWSSPVTAHFCHAYSTDPARIAEMVDWLRKRMRLPIDSFLVEVDRGRGYAAELICWPDDGESPDIGCEAAGQTIEHALALLVVAVANPAP